MAGGKKEMKLFISSEVISYGNSYPITIRPDYTENKTRLHISNMTNSQKCSIIEIPFVQKRGYSWTGSFSIDISKLIHNGNEYIFEKEEGIDNTQDNCIYALLYVGRMIEPGEMYISKEYKEKITVLEKFEFYVHNFLSEKFIDKMYLIKIDLSIDESIPIYLSTEKTDSLCNHITFYRTSFEMLSAKECNSLIILNKKNRECYIALSEL